MLLRCDAPRLAAAFPPLHTRLGVNTGPVLVGNLGSKRRFDFTGTYREVRRPTRLQFTWRWETLPIIEGPGDTSVTVEFTESAGTHVTLVQDHLPHNEALEAHRRGWDRCLDGLARLSLRE